MDIHSSRNSSHVWKAFERGVKWLFKDMRWLIGDGCLINVWHDNWIPGGPLKYCIEGPLSHSEDEIKVEFMHQVGAWNLESLTILLPNEIKELIRSIPLAQYHIQLDKLIWPNSNGQCTMKEASKFIYTHEGIQFDKSRWNWIWKTSCPQKIQIFIWKCTHNMVLALSVFDV